MYEITFKGTVISTHATEAEARCAWHATMDAAEDHDNRLLDYTVQKLDREGCDA